MYTKIHQIAKLACLVAPVLADANPVVTDCIVEQVQTAIKPEQPHVNSKDNGKLLFDLYPSFQLQPNSNITKIVNTLWSHKEGEKFDSDFYDTLVEVQPDVFIANRYFFSDKECVECFKDFYCASLQTGINRLNQNQPLAFAWQNCMLIFAEETANLESFNKERLSEKMTAFLNDRVLEQEDKDAISNFFINLADLMKKLNTKEALFKKENPSLIEFFFKRIVVSEAIIDLLADLKEDAFTGITGLLSDRFVSIPDQQKSEIKHAAKSLVETWKSSDRFDQKALESRLAELKVQVDALVEFISCLDCSALRSSDAGRDKARALIDQILRILGLLDLSTVINE